MRVAILHEAVAAGARPDELDVLEQARTVAAALAALGHDAPAVPLGTDLEAAAAALRAAAPDVVFNLVESVGGESRRSHLAPELLARLGLPFTGSAAAPTLHCGSKLLAKDVLARAGLPTPRWHTRDELRAGAEVAPGRWILKSVWEHGSVGLDADSVVEVSGGAAAAELRAALDARLAALGGEGFAEAYVHGRELNLAILEDAAGPRCLPPAEIRFGGLRADQPRIVGYRAKWSPGSAEDVGTPRCFAFAPADAPLLQRAQTLALATWRAFDLGGYARVDLRIDAAGEPWIVDVNPSPCLSPGAGFSATLEHAGLAMTEAVAKILAAAQRRCRVKRADVPDQADQRRHPAGR